MTASDAVGNPIRCHGCGAPVRQVTDAMRHRMPDTLSVDLFGDLGVEYIVCAPLPDGTQPCLRMAILRDSVLVAEMRAPDGGFGNPLVIACIPKELGDWWADAEDGYGSDPDRRLVECDNPRCGELMWLDRSCEVAAATVPKGQVLLLCMPCATVECAARDGKVIGPWGDVLRL